MSRAADLQKIERALQMLVRLYASRRVHAERAAAAGIFISQPGDALLGRIDEHGPIRLSDLGRLTHMDAATVGRQVRQLEDSGLVASNQDPADGRATLVRITTKGQEIRQRLQQIGEAHLTDVLDRWAPAERAELARLLTRLMDDFRATRFRRPAESESA